MPYEMMEPGATQPGVSAPLGGGGGTSNECQESHFFFLLVSFVAMCRAAPMAEIPVLRGVLSLLELTGSSSGFRF